MTTIPHLNTDCQEEAPDGQWQAGSDGLVYIHRNPEAAEPIATPLADALAASIQSGKVETNNAWDGWELSDIFTTLVHDGEDKVTAAAIVDDIMSERIRALNGNGHDRLDTVQAQVETEEPAAFELEISYFEDEVTA